MRFLPRDEILGLGSPVLDNGCPVGNNGRFPSQLVNFSLQQVTPSKLAPQAAAGAQIIFEVCSFMCICESTCFQILRQIAFSLTLGVSPHDRPQSRKIFMFPGTLRRSGRQFVWGDRVRCDTSPFPKDFAR